MSDFFAEDRATIPMRELNADEAQPSLRASWRGWLILLVILIGGWLLTGIFVVGADEAAVLRVCGRAQRTTDGTIRLIPSGLHFHLPWPFTQVDRVNVNEVRTGTVGGSGLEDIDGGEFLKAINPGERSQFLTGDRNILNVQLTVSYRVSRANSDRWLYASRSNDTRLQSRARSVLSDVVMRSGVDFVHTLGHAEIRRDVLARLREGDVSSDLGVEVEDVTISGVSPPIRVKSEFVDVMNARTERVTFVNRAVAYATQKEADANAARRRLLDQSETYRRRTLDSAEAEAESFNRLIDQLWGSAEGDPEAYRRVRQLALRRRWLETLEGVYRNVAGKVFLDSGQPVDITIHRNPSAD